MAQTSYTIANGSGAVVRARLNEVAAAAQSANSGGTAPTETVAGMLWFDTSVSPAVLRQRNAANTGWLAVRDVGALQAANNLSELGNAATARTNLGATATGAAVFTAASAAAARTTLGVPNLTEAQATNPASAVFGLVSGERLAAASVLSGYWSTPQQTIEVAASRTIAHPLGVAPLFVKPFLVCTTADLGFSVGQEVPVNENLNAAANASYGQSITYDASNIYLRFGGASPVYQILNNTTGLAEGITIARWRLILRVFA